MEDININLERKIKDKERELFGVKNNLKNAKSNLLLERELVNALENNILVEEKKGLCEIIDKYSNELEKERKKEKDLELKLVYNNQVINILKNEIETLKQSKTKQEEEYVKALNNLDIFLVKLKEEINAKKEEINAKKEEIKAKKEDKILDLLFYIRDVIKDIQEKTTAINNKLPNFISVHEGRNSLVTTKLSNETKEIVEHFLHDRVKKDLDGAISAADLYQEYKRYSLSLEEEPLSQRSFGGILTQLDFTKKKSNKGIIYTGINLVK